MIEMYLYNENDQRINQEEKLENFAKRSSTDDDSIVNVTECLIDIPLLEWSLEYFSFSKFEHFFFISF